MGTYGVVSCKAGDAYEGYISCTVLLVRSLEPSIILSGCTQTIFMPLDIHVPEYRKETQDRPERAVVQAKWSQAVIDLVRIVL